MATLVGANFFIYFTASDDADRVKCKLCNKSLMANRRFNLKQHLKQTHKLQVCLKPNKEKNAANANKPKKLYSTKLEKATSPSKNQNSDYSLLENKTADSGHNFFDINTQTLDSNDDSRDSGRIASPSAIDIKAERVQEVHIKNCIDVVVPHDETFDDDNNAETTTQNPPDQVLLPDDNFVEPAAKPRKSKGNGFRDPLNETDFLTKRHKFEPRSKKKGKHLSDDPLDETTSSSNDHFEQWAKKKIQLLEIELLEMRNYKIKLELYEKEQQSQLASSKFTRDIRSNR